jgi:hypothetical protein
VTRRRSPARGHVGLTRRDVMKGALAAAAWMPLAGCCRCDVTHLQPPSIPDGTLTIDPHCHLFNGRDLDIYNYAERDIEERVPRGQRVGKRVLYTITEMIRAVAPRGERELAILRALCRERDALMKAAGPSAAGAVRAEIEAKTKATVATLDVQVAETRRALLNGPNPEQQLLELWGRKAPADAREAMILQELPAARRALHEPPIASFFAGFWNARSVNAGRLVYYYPNVTLFTPAMLDIDSWLRQREFQPREPTTPLAVQLEIYECLAILTNGRFLPFLGFRRTTRNAMRTRPMRIGRAGSEGTWTGSSMACSTAASGRGWP